MNQPLDCVNSTRVNDSLGKVSLLSITSKSFKLGPLRQPNNKVSTTCHGTYDRFQEFIDEGMVEY